MSQYHLTHLEVAELAKAMADDIMEHWHATRTVLNVWAVPRGGIPVAYALQQFMHINLVDKVEDADIVIDDILESGATRDRFQHRTSRGHDVDHAWFALIDKSILPDDHPHNQWIVFPWEQGLQGDDYSVTDSITRLLQHIGEDVSREGLQETPSRVIKAWAEWSSGYAMDPAAILKTFEDGNTDEMVIERRIPFYSHCEHHMAPFFGTVDIGYIPDGKIVGLSKMNRLVECFARRLQVQERMGQQIADAMMQHLQPKGVGVIVTGKHMCAMSRGVRHSGCDMVTSAMRGCFMEGLPRQEFLALTR